MLRMLLSMVWPVMPILLALSLISCQPDAVEIPASELYTRDFVRHFGVTAGTQGWNSAVKVTADVDPQVVKRAAKITVSTAWPGNPDCFVVADYPASERSFSFDYPSDLDLAYVQVLDSEGTQIYGSYVRISKGRLHVGPTASRAISQSPVPYPFDLSANKSFGTFPTDKNPAIERFWKNYGIAIDGGSEPEEPKGPEVLTYEVPVPADLPEIDWGKTAYVDFAGIKDVPTGKVEIRMRYRAANGCTIQLNYGPDGNGWIGQMQGSASESGGESEIAIVLTNDWEYARLKAAGKFAFSGSRFTITGITVIQTTKAETVTVPDTKGTARISDLLRFYGFSVSPQTTLDGFKTDYLKPNTTYDETGYSVTDLVPIIGRKNGVFREEINKETLECNLEKYREELNPEEGVKYVVANEGTEVSVDYLFGSASTMNSFGYFYCSAEEAALPEEERMKVLFKKPMFVLIYSANQWTNMQLQMSAGGEWTMQPDYSSFSLETSGPNEGKDSGDNWKHCTHFSDLVQNAENGEYADGAFVPRFRSTRYQLVYYSSDEIDADGRLKPGARGSYKFPKGTNIGFFIISGGQYALDRDGSIGQGALIDHRRIAFSRPVMNRYIGNTINDGHTHQTTGGNNSIMTNGTGDAKDWTAFVRYRWNGQRLLGVEDYFAENDGGRDGGDHDMNDIIFRVNGEFENKAEELNKNDDRKISWIIACEDLGGTYDFDFNDIVFGITHVNGSGVATVTALAAGGTLPAYILSSYPQIDADGNVVPSSDGILRPANAAPDGEFHTWWGADRSSKVTINVETWTGRGESVTVKVPDDFGLTLDDNSSVLPADEQGMGGFRVMVGKPGEGNSTIITAPHKNNSFEAPQMFLVPSKWFWPVEEQEIDGVYSGFIKWVDSWWTKRDGYAGGRVIQHAWPTFMENNQKDTPK